MICLRKKKAAMERISIKVAVLFLVLLAIDLAGYTLVPAEVKIEETVGKIVSVDITTNILIVKTRYGEISIGVNEKTQITMGREEKLFSDLKVGNKVKAHYIITDGDELAERIMVKPLTKK